MKKVISILLVCILVLSFVACGKKVPSWQDQYDLGCRYLSEGKYEEAIIAFESAIKIDAKKVEAYKSLSEVYNSIGETEKAIQILLNAFDATGDDSLNTLIDSIRLTEDKKTSGKLELSNISYTCDIGPEYILESNNESIGSLNLHAQCNGPKDVENVLIIGWFENTPSEEEIFQKYESLLAAWKNVGFKLYEKVIPFDCDNSRPVYKEDLGRTQYVLLGGFNSELELIAYSVIPVEIK